MAATREVPDSIDEIPLAWRQAISKLLSVHGFFTDPAKQPYLRALQTSSPKTVLAAMRDATDAVLPDA